MSFRPQSDTAIGLVLEADQQRVEWLPLDWLRDRSLTYWNLAAAYLKAQALGVRIKGQLTLEEQEYVLKLKMQRRSRVRVSA